MQEYEYKTICVDGGGLFGTTKTQMTSIQKAIDVHVAEGWELFQYHPVQTALVWKWNVLIFRRNKD
mgnify:CR=1 FL=1